MSVANGRSRPFDVTNRSVIAIALPMTFAYLSTPLVGFTDTAVIGRLGDAALLGGVAIGAVIFDLIFTSFNFMRAGTTGLTAQALGAGDGVEQRAVLLRALAMAVVIGLAVVLLRQPIAEFGVALMGGSDEVRAAGARYVDIRIFATPFVLANYAIVGWILGQGRAGAALVLQSFLNGLNVGLDIWLVLGLGWGIEGVAHATLIAEAATCLAGIFYVALRLRDRPLPAFGLVFDAARFRRMIGLNRDIMIRSFALLIAFAFFTREGARSGDIILAANAVLLHFFMIGGYFLDGIATAAEQLAGRAVGARYRPAFDKTVWLTLLWGGGLALSLTLIFLAAGPLLIDVMTTSPEVRDTARNYLIWAVLTPVAGVVAFQMDGIYIGSTWSGEMRNMMLVSLAAYFAVWFAAAPALGNHGLWLALLVFLALRGVTLSLRVPAKADETFGRMSA